MYVLNIGFLQDFENIVSVLHYIVWLLNVKTRVVALALDSHYCAFTSGIKTIQLQNSFLPRQLVNLHMALDVCQFVSLQASLFLLTNSRLIHICASTAFFLTSGYVKLYQWLLYNHIPLIWLPLEYCQRTIVVRSQSAALGLLRCQVNVIHLNINTN